jgi:PAS domain S-box-containing protein|nr:hybrid sensor histidine kinase/response regulator [Methylobacterium aquaticum]
MGAMMRAHDWSGSALGPPETWPAGLGATVSLLLGSRFPMFVAFGPELRFLYNDAYAEILGDKHPSALGGRFRDIWSEIWPDIAPLIERALSGEPTWSEDMPLVLRRHGYDERTWFTFSYSALRDEDGRVVGMFCACTETTGRVVAETGLREAEAQLRTSEARLRLATEAAEIGLWDVDVVGDTLFWPARVKTMFGISPEVPVSMADFYAGIHPDDREATVAAYAAATDPGRRAVYDVEYRTVGKEDGQVRWVAAKGRGLFENGACTRVVGTAIDVTPRKQAEAALRGSEEQFRVLSQVLPNLVWSTDPEGRTVWFNERTYAYTGVLPGVLDTEGWRALIHPDDRDRVTAEWHAALAGHADYQCEYRLRRADGTYRWFLARAQPVLSDEGAITRWVGTTTDIDDQKRMMAELVRLNETLEQRVAARTTEHDRVWRNSRDLLVVIGADGIFRAVNPAWEAILGHRPAEVVGRSFLDFLWPEDAEATSAALESALAARHLTNFENRYTHRDGTPRWLSWHTSVEGGLVFASGRDVTAEKVQAAALAQAEEALRQSQKLEAVGQLTGGVAHDFNNLLTIIRSSVDFLRRPDLPEARRSRYLTAVSETVDRAAKLTSQLLAFARRQALKPETLDVGARLRVVAELIDTVTGARITVATQVPDHPCFVRVDASQFETALVNMAVNARDAMEGAGTLTLALACGVDLPPIRGHAGAVGPFAAVSLHDTGTGIPSDLLARVFEPFFTTKEVGRGTGLGLSQVFGFAKQSGGDVAVESVPGQGTTFTLYLPEVEAEFAAGDAAPGDPGQVDPGGVGQRVLVVEDNLEVGRFATQILEDLGYATTWAVNAEDALEKLGPDGAGFDVVFSDVVMPGMGGIALARHLARRFPDLPVVLASGYSHVLAEESSAGFDLLQKPYSAEQVSRILRKVTRRGLRRPVGA